MTFQEATEFLKGFKLHFKSFNPLEFELEDVNPNDAINSSGSLIVDISNKKYSIKLNIEAKF